MDNKSGPIICQVVGYKNAGKTTVMNQLISYYSLNKKRVGTIKHHGHGGEPDIVKNTDSTEHIAAGSTIGGVTGENITLLTIPEHLELCELITMYHTFLVDIILIEGYKQADFPKIVLVKNREDMTLLTELTNIIAVGSWNEKLVQYIDYPVFDINAVDAQQLSKLIATIAKTNC